MPLLVMPPRNVGVIAALSVQLERVLMVTRPTNVLTGLVTELNTNAPPATPLPIVVAPLTVSVKPATVNVVPSPIDRFPTVRFAAVVAVAIPLRVRLLPMVVIAPNVSAPPLSVRL